MKKIITIVSILLSNFVYSQNLNSIGNSIFSLTVQERIKHNIKSKIFMSKSLCEVAKIQAELILRTGIPTHTNPNPLLKSVEDRVKKYGYMGAEGENITYFSYNNESDDSISKRAINNFMSSIGHRITLLKGDAIKNSNYKTAYGQCILFDSKRKKIIVVQVFVTCYYESDLLIE